MKTFAGFIAAKTAITIPAALLGGLLFLLLFGGVVVLLFYIFKSVGIYRIAKDQGVKAPGLAWLPIFDLLILGRSADHIRKKDGAEHSGFGGWIFFLSLIIIAGSIAITIATGKTSNSFGMIKAAMLTHGWLLPVLIVVLCCSLALIVLEIVVLGFVYQELSKAHVALLILSLIFSFLTPVFLFAVRKNGKKKEEEPYEDIPPLQA